MSNQLVDFIRLSTPFLDFSGCRISLSIFPAVGSVSPFFRLSNPFVEFFGAKIYCRRTCRHARSGGSARAHARAPVRTRTCTHARMPECMPACGHARARGHALIVVLHNYTHAHMRRDEDPWPEQHTHMRALGHQQADKCNCAHKHRRTCAQVHTHACMRRFAHLCKHLCASARAPACP